MTMDFNRTELNDWIEKLKCAKCKNYLSYFPIYLTADNDNICGRCPVAEEEINIVNEIYEIVANQIRFPCRYTDEGCYEKLRPEDVPHHEANCTYRKITCLTTSFTQCKETVTKPNLLQHCQTRHSDIMLQDGKFKIALSKSHQCYNLLKHEDQILIVTRKFKLENNVLQFAITRREDQSEYIVSPYELNLNCGNRSLLINCKVTSKTYMNEISVESLINRMVNSSTISGRICIGTTVKPISAETLNKEMLNLVKCSKCSEYILPPINISSENQRCLKCFQQNTYNTYNNRTVKNSKLDTVANLLYYPCIYQKNGCLFMSHPQQIKGHQAFCPFRTEICPVKEYVNCNWSGFGKELESHIIASHQNIIVNNNNSSISESISQMQNYHATNNNYYYDNRHNLRFSKCYVLRFSRHFFKLIFFQVEPQKYYWTMQMIGEFQDKFRYEIEIIDANDSDNAFSASKSCSSEVKKEELLNNKDKYCYFQHEQIQQLLKQNMISFKVRIFSK